jgi:ParB-like chromosome segregation protein Spo0J
MNADTLIQMGGTIAAHLQSLTVEEQVRVLNEVRSALHTAGPFSNEPVDATYWVLGEQVVGNPYNPNAVAPPEMRLLEHSIRMDGYTQPIVGWGRDGVVEVVDGFHRHRVGREVEDIRTRLHGYLPVAIIRTDREGANDRRAATVRHNRARGKHQVDAMSELVADLAKRNWTDQRIAKELGMEPDEVLRLKQITGLAELFMDQEFSEAWGVEGFDPASPETFTPPS